MIVLLQLVIEIKGLNMLIINSHKTCMQTLLLLLSVSLKKLIVVLQQNN